MAYVFLCLLVLSIGFSLTAGWWFNALPFVKRVKQQAKQVDDLHVQIMGYRSDALYWVSPVFARDFIDVRIKTKELRTQREVGNAVTAAHFIANFSSVVERRMSRTFAGGLLVSVALGIVFILIETQRLMSNPGANIHTFAQIWERFLDAGLATFGTPTLSLIGSAVVSGLSIFLYEEMVSRCKVDFDTLRPRVAAQEAHGAPQGDGRRAP